MNSLTFLFGVASTSSTTCSMTGLEALRLNDGSLMIFCASPARPKSAGLSTPTPSEEPTTFDPVGLPAPARVGGHVP